MTTRSPGKEGRYDLENSIGYLLNRAANLIAARFGDDLKPHGVNIQTWRILAALSQSGDQTMSELANHSGAELSYLSRSVAALEKQGLVERAPSPVDKRIALLSLTNAGWDVVEELAPKGRAMERLSATKVPAADLQVTLRTLRAFCHNLIEIPATQAAVNRKLTVARRVKNRAQSQEEESTPKRRKAA